MDIEGVLEHWPIARGGTVRPVEEGTNNRTWFVDAPDGEFVMQVLLNVRDRSCLVALHDLLHLLARSGLPFAVPVPLPTREGGTWVPLDDGRRFAVLTRRIEGRYARPGDPGQAASCAQALRHLHRALASIEAPERYVCGRRIGKLDGIHPAIDSPDRLIGMLPVADSQQRELAMIFDDVRLASREIDASLPAQIVHADLFPSNMLMHDGRISAILDFEAAAMGPWHSDVAVALWTCVLLRDDSEPGWGRAGALLRAYLGDDPLPEREAELLPEFIRIREAQSFLGWGGRMVDGLTTTWDMVNRAERLISVHRWVSGNRARLSQLANDTGSPTA